MKILEKALPESKRSLDATAAKSTRALHILFQRLPTRILAAEDDADKVRRDVLI
jgi:hypothetical protein